MIALLRHFLTLAVGAQLVLLRSVLLALTITATDTLCRHALVTKGSPGTKVLAALAPLDFEAIRSNDLHVHVAECAESLVLSGNNGRCCPLQNSGHEHFELPSCLP